jgi:hypothetical protein
MASPVLPINIDFPSWAAHVGVSLSKIMVPLPTETKNWRYWATAVLCINTSLVGNVPTPDTSVYPKDEDWREWAAKFIQVVYNPQI